MQSGDDGDDVTSGYKRKLQVEVVILEGERMGWRMEKPGTRSGWAPDVKTRSAPVEF